MSAVREQTENDLEESVHESIRRHHFHEQVNGLKCIEGELIAFHKAKKSDPGYKSDYLIQGVKGHLERERRNKNRQQQRVPTAGTDVNAGGSKEEVEERQEREAGDTDYCHGCTG